MSEVPKVSIILVNYNGYADTIECLQSLRKITYPNYEVIVVDNASTNDSVNRIKEFIRSKESLICSKSNEGFSSGNNIGLQYALKEGTDYCLLLNNDTIVEPNFLDELVKGFDYSSKCGLTIGKILYESKRDTIWYAGGSISGRTAKTKHWHYREIDSETFDKIKPVTFATGCCMCLSKKVIERIGFLDEDYFLYEEDADYCCRIREAGFDMMYTPDSRIYHKVSSSTSKLSDVAQYYLIRNKYILIDKHYEGISRSQAKAFCTIQFIYRCFKKEFQLGMYWRALKAYRHHKVGKACF